MEIIQLLLKELDAEAQATRNMLGRVPDDKWDWQPHQKSMTMKQLTVHLAELPSWISMALHTTELDFAAMEYKPTQCDSKAELIQIFEKSLQTGRQALANAQETDLTPTWTMRSGDYIHAVMTKYEVIRHALAQTIHHRAQLGVYLRLLNIAIPGTYGPSADEQTF
jgi:uncharacterized damage-inducible protein DinB